MSKKNPFATSIRPVMQRKIAKMGRLASGAGKTMRSTGNSKHNNNSTG